MKEQKYSLFKYTWPIFIELLLQMFVGNIDQMMIAYDSQNSVAAVGNANQILNLLIWLFSTMSLAMSILVTQYFGSKQYKKISTTYTMSLILNGGFALVVALVLLFSQNAIFGFMQVPSEILKDAKLYLSIIAIGLPVQALYSTYVTMFRTQGWMKQTMVMSAIVNIINIVGNYLLIFGIGIFPPLHVAGIAISTNISRLIGLFALAYIFNKNSEIKLGFPKKEDQPLQQLSKIVGIAIPSSTESVSYDLSQIVIMKVVNTFGTKVINTKIYAGVLATFSFVYGNALSSATQIIVGYMIGAKEYEKTHQQVMKTMWMSILTAGTLSILLFMMSDSLFSIFTSDPEVLALGKKIMFVEIFLEIGRAVNLTMVRSLQSTQDVKYPAYVGIVSMWGIATLFSYILGQGFGLGLVGVWIAMAMDECLRGLLFIIRWNKKDWMKREIA